MESTPIIPYCVPEGGEIVPMLVVSAAFLYGTWFVRHWKQKRRARKKGDTD